MWGAQGVVTTPPPPHTHTRPAACRVMTTPLPFAYLVHLRSFMAIWLGGLPWIYNPIDLSPFVSLAVNVLIAYSILGLDAITVQVGGGGGGGGRGTAAEGGGGVQVGGRSRRRRGGCAASVRVSTYGETQRAAGR
jgi:hypothetical protein